MVALPGSNRVQLPSPGALSRSPRPGREASGPRNRSTDEGLVA